MNYVGVVGTGNNGLIHVQTKLEQRTLLTEKHIHDVLLSEKAVYEWRSPWQKENPICV